MKACHLLIPVFLLMVVLSAGCSQTAPAPSATSPATPAGSASATLTSAPAAGAFTLHVGSVAQGGTLPTENTCLGSFASPAISWENVPAGAKTLTLIMEDPDAPKGTYTHWIVYNIPPSRKSLPAGIGAVKEIDGGGQQGSNSNGERGYAAACPPLGSKHRYVFTLYAVDYQMGLPTADREGITVALNGHWTEDAVVTTTFSR